MIAPETALLTESELAELPIFPLPNAVLFPGVSIGLHLFEPRYRAMMRHCIEHGPRAMAMAHLKPGFEATYEGQPPIFEIAGAGRIVSHRGNADGTFDLILEGTQRVRLHELPFAPPFRRAKAETLGDRGNVGVVLAVVADLARQFAAAATVASASPIPPPELHGPPGRVLDLLIDRFVRDPRRRQELLETLDVERRLHAIRDALAEVGLDRERWKRAN